jgi:hypothetical protein
MLNIYKRVKELESELVFTNSDVKAGFELCLEFFNVGIRKSERYNLHLKINELEKKVKSLTSKNIKLETDLDDAEYRLLELSGKIKSKVETIANYPNHPSGYYLLDTIWGVVTIKTNAPKSSITEAYRIVEPIMTVKYKHIEPKIIYSRLAGKLQSMGFKTNKPKQTEIINEEKIQLHENSNS